MKTSCKPIQFILNKVFLTLTPTYTRILVFESTVRHSESVRIETVKNRYTERHTLSNNTESDQI